MGLGNGNEEKAGEAKSDRSKMHELELIDICFICKFILVKIVADYVLVYDVLFTCIHLNYEGEKVPAHQEEKDDAQDAAEKCTKLILWLRFA